MKSGKRICLISLGCAKNLVDSEHMLGILREKGYALVARPEEAEIAIVNTCGFVQPAVEEAIDTILEVSSQKGKGGLEKVFVAGCLVQRYGYKLRTEMPEIDGWLGTGEVHRIAELVEHKGKGPRPFFLGRPRRLADHTTPRVASTPFYTAYLRIAEGCSHRCSYCTIPRLRGPFRSRGPESLLREAEKMVERGVKEINLVAQDTTMYGQDPGAGSSLEDLLERLVGIPGIKWIRVLYSHPHRVTNRLLDLLEREEGLCPYLDIPFQHVSEKILKAMGRLRREENPWQLVERIQSRTRRLSLRTTLMVGFPGEEEEDFRELYRFVETRAFDHIGTFVFSPEEGTRAGRAKDLVDPSVGRERRDAVMALQAGISGEKNSLKVGRTVPTLIEGISQESELLLRGRTSSMAPDVDGQVLINKGTASAGEIVPVLITEAHTYDLVGEIIEPFFYFDKPGT